MADATTNLEEKKSSDGAGGIYPFSPNTHSLVTLTVSAEGHILKGHSDLRSTPSAMPSAFTSMAFARVNALALASNVLIEAPAGVQGDPRPCVVFPIGAFAAPLDGWTLVLHFGDTVAWDSYVSSNISSCNMYANSATGPDDDKHVDSIYQNAVWLVKVLRQWLRGIELEREDRHHRKSLRYLR